jgi:hypothetical protein
VFSTPGLGQLSLTAGAILLLLAPLADEAKAEPPEASPDMIQNRRARWLESTDQVLVGPYYSIAEGQQARLILVNRFADPIDYEARAVSLAGQTFPLGGDSVPPRGVVEIDLQDALSIAPASFDEGSIEIRYFGDPEMTQAWTVLSGPFGPLEQPLTKTTLATSREWTSFWDLSMLGSSLEARPLFAFHNSGGAPVLLTLSWIPSEGDPRVVRRGISSAHTALIEPPGRSSDSTSGRMIARHDGEPGQVSVAAFLADGSAVLSALPMASPESLQGSRDLEGLGFPAVEGVRAAISILDARYAGEPQAVRLALLYRESGALFASADMWFRPGDIRTVQLSSLIPSDAAVELRDLRVSISSQEGRIMAAGLVLPPDGTVVDMALIPRAKAHDSGTYPVPAIETHEVATTFVNVGEETAQLFGHFTSDRGEYALEPIEVAPGASYRLDFGALAALEQPDRLGRRLDPAFDLGFFQWFSRRGSSELLARTEARRKGDSDLIGFNCFGCCAESPSGAVIPQSIGFDVGESPELVAVEYVDTCAGPTGPYYAYPNALFYSAPLTWNGQAISTTAYANQQVAFQGSGEYTTVTCSTKTITFFGSGKATSDKCLKENHPEFDPKRSCGDQTPNCSACYTCCDKQKDTADCRCAFLGSPSSCTEGARASCQKCKQVCVGAHAETCNQQVTDCP